MKTPQPVILNGRTRYGISRGSSGTLWCDDCQRPCCQQCGNCDCDGFPCEHQTDSPYWWCRFPQAPPPAGA